MIKEIRQLGIQVEAFPKFHLFDTPRDPFSTAESPSQNLARSIHKYIQKSIALVPHAG